MAKVTVVVEIDSRWVKAVHSPVYWAVAALQGVALTFAPLFLFWSGRGRFFHGVEWIVVPVCFAMIYLVGMFNGALAAAVVKGLRKE
jgi:hypothetical protein